MTPCDEWTGRTNSNGYGYLTLNDRTHYAHRIVWAQDNGPIPDGMCVLHSCDNPLCIEITHLRLGSHAENMRDMAERRRGRNSHMAQTECIHGHQFDEENTRYNSRGWRQCRACARARYHEYKRRKEAS